MMSSNRLCNIEKAPDSTHRRVWYMYVLKWQEAFCVKSRNSLHHTGRIFRLFVTRPAKGPLFRFPALCGPRSRPTSKHERCFLTSVTKNHANRHRNYSLMQTLSSATHLPVRNPSPSSNVGITVDIAATSSATITPLITFLSTKTPTSTPTVHMHALVSIAGISIGSGRLQDAVEAIV